jgi:hypothetical protein
VRDDRIVNAASDESSNADSSAQFRLGGSELAGGHCGVEAAGVVVAGLLEHPVRVVQHPKHHRALHLHHQPHERVQHGSRLETDVDRRPVRDELGVGVVEPRRAPRAFHVGEGTQRPCDQIRDGCRSFSHLRPLPTLLVRVGQAARRATLRLDGGGAGVGTPTTARRPTTADALPARVEEPVHLGLRHVDHSTVRGRVVELHPVHVNHQDCVVEVSFTK